MFNFLAPNICRKHFCFLCISYYNLFSLFIFIYLLIKSTLIISEKAVLLELTHPLLVYVDLSSSCFNSLQYLLFYFWFSFLFQFVPLLQIILVFFLHLFTSNNAFRLRYFLTSLSWLSSLLFHQGCFSSPFVLFKYFSHQFSSYVKQVIVLCQIFQFNLL